jgi:sugar lactone lactonase YvrE
MAAWRRIGDSIALLGEGPVWCPREQALYWVDIRGCAVHRHAWGEEETEIWAMPAPVGSLALREEGGLVLALRDGLYFFDPATGAMDLVAAPHAGKTHLRFNDGKCDRQGRFWVGSMNDETRAPHGALYRLDPDRSCTAMLADIDIPNSLCWSPDGATMYFSDSQVRRVSAYPFDPASGTLGPRRDFAAVAAPAVPDGATVDAEGFVWCAHWGGWRVTRYAPDGRVDRVLDVPMAHPTSCAFGGPDLATLFLTSASAPLDAAARRAQPLAGAMLATDVGVRGLVEPRFAG